MVLQQSRLLLSMVIGGVYLLLTACSTEVQSIALTPKVKLFKQNIGHNRTIALTIIDARNNHSLGNFANNHNIVIGHELQPIINNKIIHILRSYQFRVVTSTNPYIKRRLTIRISALHYAHSRRIHIYSALLAIAQNHQQEMERKYQTKHQQQLAFTPISDTDQAHVNAALSNTLTKFANDKILMRFLAH